VNVNLETGSVGYRWQNLMGIRHLLNALGSFVLIKQYIHKVSCPCATRNISEDLHLQSFQSLVYLLTYLHRVLLEKLTGL
jgi:hypothetical protein